jgi:SNF2 family DNA or RNA helicase
MKNSEDLTALVKKLKLPFKPVPLQLTDAMEAYYGDRFALLYAVGGGKTLVSTLVSLLWEEPHTLIVCPPILLPQWEAWLHSIKEMDTSIYSGPKRTVSMLDHRWVIMSHAIFRDSSVNIQKFYKGRVANIIIDEAQSLKNARSVLFKSVNQFIAPDRRILLLTATPTSKPEDSYSYMKIKTPQIYRSFGQWKNIHVESEDIFGTYTGYKNLDLLAENFAICSATRDKKELFGDDLGAVYQPMLYDLSPAHLKLYYRLAEEQLLLLPDGNKIDATTSQRLYHALQQIVINFAKFSGKETDKSAGLDLLDEVISQVDPMDKGKSKFIVWTYYRSTSRLVTEYLRNQFGEQAVVAAYGEVNSAKSVQSIMFDDNCRILVAQPSSVGVGLNLQHNTSECLFLEQSTTPMQTIQSVGRIARTGQKIKPTIRFAQARGTIQLKLFQDLLNKADLVAQVERVRTSLRDEIFGNV